MSISRSILGFAAALALAGALVPALASAQTAPYYGNCNDPYSTNYPYPSFYDPYIGSYPNGYPQNQYCGRGTLFVYVQVNATVNSYYGRQTNDFTVSISGGNAYPATLQGSPNGQLVSVLGSYSVTAASFQGFTPSYSGGCTGALSQGQQTTCVITENPIYPYNYQPPYNYAPYPYYNTAQPAPVYVTPSYVPKLPNTGFEPQDGAAMAFAAAALIALVFITLPYVRKAFATLLG